MKCHLKPNSTRWIILTAVTLSRVSTPAYCQTQPHKAVDARLTRSFTATKKTNLDATVVDFVNGLIGKNAAGVGDQYHKLTASTQADASGRYSATAFRSIRWFVNEHYGATTHQGADFETTDDFTYLAWQQLIFGFHHGYSTPVNVVARVRVRTARVRVRTALVTKVDAAAPKDGWVAPKTKVTLTFEGFLKSVPVTAPAS